MKIKTDKIIKSMLGNDFFEILKKSDIYKPTTRTVTSINEMETGLKIVPRAIMSFLVANLSGLQNQDNRELDLPFAMETKMHIVKMAEDTFSGYIYSKGKKINEFQNRSIPGIGLILMTTFELYNLEDLKDVKEKEKEIFDINKLQDIIDERLKMHSLISRIVDQKLAQRDAVEILIKEKIAQALLDIQVKHSEEKSDSAVGSVEQSKSDRLKQFLKEREEKRHALEFNIEKKEQISCPDCGQKLYKGGNTLDLCICYGEDWGKNLKIKKTENSMKVIFPKNIDKENIDILLQTLKEKK